MEKIDFLLDSTHKELEVPHAPSSRLYFPLGKYGYILKGILNNENRWHTKIVCSILNNRDFKHYVSTTYAAQSDYLKLIETTTFLQCNNEISPKIIALYPQDNTVVCEYIGEFLSSYLLNNPTDILSSLTAVFEYLKEINCINRSYKTFIIPSIVKTSLELSSEFACSFEFLPKSKGILPKLEKSANRFLYGCGVEDPHIWNFRIVKSPEKTLALTTDFDYFSHNANCFWELGYFYATLRWLEKSSFSLKNKAEKILLSLIEKQDLKAEFMFWLGALSSYCGYKDSLRNLIATGEIAQSELEVQYKIVRHLDEKVSYLARELL